MAASDGDGRPGRPRTSAEPRTSGGREPPHNLDLERSVLAVLLDGSRAVAMQKVRPLVPHPLLFWNRDHRLVYLACLELDDAGAPIDAQGVAELLSRLRFDAALDRLREAQAMFESDQLDRVGRDRLRKLWTWDDADRNASGGDSTLAAIGGQQTVFRIVDATGSFAALERNSHLLRDYYLKRRLISRLGEIADQAHLTTDEFSALVDRAGQTVLDLGRLDRTAVVHEMSTAADETMIAIRERIDNPNQGIKTGMVDIDEKLMALRPGGLYILAARPGVGKTSLALRIVQGIVSNPEQAHRVLFFSLEVDRRDLLKKMIAAVGKIEFKALDQGTLPEDQFLRLEETIKVIRDWPMEMMDVADLTVHQLRSVVKRRMLETDGKLKLIVIDYLQLLQSSRPDQDEYAKISEITRVLKVLSMEQRIPVVALSQMSRDSEKGSAPREPRLSDLRGSGSIEQDADAVLFIHRVDSEDMQGPDAHRTIKIVIAKNRFGPTGHTLMRFFPAKMSFEQATEEREEDGDGGRFADARESRGERLKARPGAGEDMFDDQAPAP
jgi:replicative DNA helicase